MIRMWCDHGKINVEGTPKDKLNLVASSIHEIQIILEFDIWALLVLCIVGRFATSTACALGVSKLLVQSSLEVTFLAVIHLEETV